MTTEDKVDQLVGRHSWLCLYSGSEVSKHLKMLATDVKHNAEIEPNPKKIMTEESFGGSV